MSDNQKPSPENELNAHEAARRLQIGKFFQGALKDKGWTQGKLSEEAQCSQSMVSLVLTGKAYASPELLKNLLAALGLPADAIDKLPGLGFDPGSEGFQLKIIIIRALVAGDIPNDGHVDARNFIENEWDYPAYRELARSRNLDDAVWSSLVADRYFEVDDDGHYRPLPIYYDLKGSLLLYLAVMASAMSTVRNLPPELRSQAMAKFDKSLAAWETSLDKADQLGSAIDGCSYSLAAGDRMLSAALLGHASALKFFLEVGASVMAGKAEHYVTIVMPFFKSTLKALQAARDNMVSDNPNPTGNLMASFGNEIDEIIGQWKNNDSE